MKNLSQNTITPPAPIMVNNPYNGDKPLNVEPILRFLNEHFDNNVKNLAGDAREIIDELPYLLTTMQTEKPDFVAYVNAHDLLLKVARIE